MPTLSAAAIGVARAPDVSQMTVMLTFARSLDGLALEENDIISFPGL